MPNSFKIRLKNLPILKKIVLLGAFFMTIGVFMPWYNDIDKFRIGESFLGISGPLYLAGFLVFLAGAASLFVIIMQLMEKSLPKLPLKELQLHILGSILSFLMLVLTASVYFHPKFGVNLTDKSVGFGMILAFIGAGLILLGSILSLRSKEISFDVDGHIDPLIDMNLQNREKSDLGLKKPEDELKKDITVGEAMEKYAGNKEKGWGPVQESINNVQDERRNDQQPG